MATHFVVPQVDLAPCPGWTGGAPRTQREGSDAAAATLHRAECDERKMKVALDVLAAGPR